jgi:hypothetical protein
MNEKTVLTPAPDVRLWIEQETVHLKAIEPTGDAVEITEHDVERVIAALHSLLVHLRAKGAE